LRRWIGCRTCALLAVDTGAARSFHPHLRRIVGQPAEGHQPARGAVGIGHHVLVVHVEDPPGAIACQWSISPR
jgi:hypothetical protein